MVSYYSLICISLKSNDAKPLSMFYTHIFKSWVYSMLYIYCSLSHLGLSCLRFPQDSNSVILNDNICIYLRAFTLFIYLLACKCHKIRNLVYLIYQDANQDQYMTHKLSTRLVEWILYAIKYYLVLPLAFPVASLHTYSHFKSSFPHQFGQISCSISFLRDERQVQKCRWEFF